MVNEKVGLMEPKELKWEIEKMPGTSPSYQCYYIVKLGGRFVMKADKRKEAKQFIEMFGKEIKKHELRYK